MNNLAQHIEQPRPELEYAEVVGQGAEGVTVRTSTARFAAQRALSCLVQPLPGDTVLLSRGGRGQNFILSVLERPDAAQVQTTLQVDGDLAVETTGRLSMTSGDNIRLTSGQEVGLAAAKISMHAAEAEGSFEQTTITSRFFEGRFERIRQIAQSVDSFFGRVVERMKTSHRRVEQAEDVQVGQARYLVDGTWTVHTKQTMHTSQGHVKIDAETVQLNQEYFMFANTMMGGVQMGFPDTCVTPGVAAGAPAPVPYPNIAMGPTTIPPTNAMTVLVSCAPAQNQLTMGTLSNGDNAGVMLGVASGMVMGPQGYTMGSLTVFMGGPPAQRLTSITKHNGASMNDPGVSAVPSQVKCLVLG